MRRSRIYPLIGRSFEVLESKGVRAASMPVGPRSGSARAGDSSVDASLAFDLMTAVLQLPANWNLAAMCVAMGANPRLAVESTVAEVVPLVERALGDAASRWGRFGVEYFVWYWVEQNCGSPVPLAFRRSFREFAEICGDAGHEAVRRWYLATVEPVLTGWCIAAEGKLEPLCEKLFPIRVLEVA